MKTQTFAQTLKQIMSKDSTSAGPVVKVEHKPHSGFL